MGYKNQCGAALITALMILAICAALATFMLANQRLLIRQSQLVLSSDRLSAMLDGVQDWAIEMVEKAQDINKIKPLSKTLNDISLNGKIYPLSGKFNINALEQEENIPRFALLLQTIDKSMDKSQAIDIASSVNDWLFGDGHTDKSYAKFNPPYRASHQRLVNLSELRLIRGINLKLYTKLVLGDEAYLTALPDNNSPVNINYASIPVLMTIGDLSLSQATELFRCRQVVGHFNTVDEFISRCANGVRHLNRDRVTTDNGYFLLVGSAEKDGQYVYVKSLLKSYKSNGKVKATIVWQEYNGE